MRPALTETGDHRTAMATETILKDYVEHQLRMQGDDVSVAPDDDLFDVGFDSIAYVRLIAFIKKTFDFDVPPLDVTPDRFGTLASISGYLKASGVG